MSAVTDKGGSIGDVCGVECPAWVMFGGERYDYCREAYYEDIGGVLRCQMTDGEIHLSPGVVYRKADKNTEAPCCAGECEYCIGDY